MQSTRLRPSACRASNAQAGSPPGYGFRAGFVPRGHVRKSRSREYGMPNYRVEFAKEILGVPFTIGSVEIMRARDPDRALRAAELRFARHHGIGDWRERADLATLAERH
jgi:hypothetical protein